jgi:hypothetical protein
MLQATHSSPVEVLYADADEEERLACGRAARRGVNEKELVSIRTSHKPSACDRVAGNSVRAGCRRIRDLESAQAKSNVPQICTSSVGCME